MSQARVLDFLLALKASPGMLARYEGRNLAQMLFHAKNDGYAFSADDLADVAGKLEASVILNKDKDQFNETSQLWRQMWGRRHLGYLIDHVVKRHTDHELRELIGKGGWA
ncbi:MAG: hypothetical protein AB7P40_16975 [Chloroflexota bacterium]